MNQLIECHKKDNIYKIHFFNFSGIFKEEFSKYREDFPGVCAESYFLATVMHSLDHYQTAKILKLTDLSPNILPIHYESLRVVIECFTAKPNHIIDTRFSAADHPFYQNVYKRANKLNPEFASIIDCCIDV